MQHGVTIKVGRSEGHAKASLMLSVLGSGPSRSFLVALIVKSPIEHQRLAVGPQHQIATGDDAPPSRSVSVGWMFMLGRVIY